VIEGKDIRVRNVRGSMMETVDELTETLKNEDEDSVTAETQHMKTQKPAKKKELQVKPAKEHGQIAEDALGEPAKKKNAKTSKAYSQTAEDTKVDNAQKELRRKEEALKEALAAAKKPFTAPGT
jgi:hypothetical protein